ncbi:hypothetical protein ACCO45_004740 [Purpureocillium lilacinum]|uniref:Uncharacterized protein n=1 Tax=Purpureocillium lilacinum TaxID=33203 RepID=A0ACC4DU27_PURLI
MAPRLAPRSRSLETHRRLLEFTRRLSPPGSPPDRCTALRCDMATTNRISPSGLCSKSTSTTPSSRRRPGNAVSVPLQRTTPDAESAPSFSDK